MEECNGELRVIEVNNDTLGDYNKRDDFSNSGNSRRRDWSEMTEDVLRLIIYRLNHMVDRIVLSKVCRSWRSLVLASISPHSNNQLRYGLPCLVYVRESAIHLLDPVNGHRHKFDDLPSWPNSSLEGADQVMSCVDGWLLMSQRHHDNTDNGQDTLSMAFLNLLSKARIELPTMKTTAYGQFVVSDTPTSPSCLVVGFLYSAFFDVHIALCRRGDEEWRIVERPSNIVFHDFFTNPIWCAGSVYCLDARGNLGVFDPNAETWTVMQKQEDLGKDINRLPEQYLVECAGELLRVCDLGYDSVVVVFRFDTLTNSWVQVKDLGDKILFVGRQDCVSITNPMVNHIKGNIYFNRLCGNYAVINRSVALTVPQRRSPTTTMVSTPASGSRGNGKLKELLFSSWVDLDYCCRPTRLEWTTGNSSM